MLTSPRWPLLCAGCPWETNTKKEPKKKPASAPKVKRVDGQWNNSEGLWCPLCLGFRV